VWKSSVCETELKILVRSAKIDDHDRSEFCFCGKLINFSMESCMVLMMKSMLLGVPTA
jgi:hypothetical protein